MKKEDNKEENKEENKKDSTKFQTEESRIKNEPRLLTNQQLKDLFIKKKSENLEKEIETYADQQINTNCYLNPIGTSIDITNELPEKKNKKKTKEAQIDKNCLSKEEKEGESIQLKKLNEFFIIYNKNKIIIYDTDFKKILKSLTFEDSISCINESNNEREKIIIVSLKNGNIYKVKVGEMTTPRREMNVEKKSCHFILEIENNLYLGSNKEGTFLCKNYYDNKTSESLSKIIFKIGKIINKRNIILISNMNGKGILYFFDIKKQKTINEIKIKNEKFNTSFILSENCISLFDLEKSKIKILICGCENGILAVKLVFNDDDELLIKYTASYFFELNDCKINCIHSLKNQKKIIKILDDKENEIIYSYYFIVNLINENKQSENRIYSVKGLDKKCMFSHDFDIIQKGFIKVGINDEELHKDVKFINQISKEDNFIIYSFPNVKIYEFYSYLEE